MIELLISAWDWFNAPIVEGVQQSIIPLVALGAGALMGAYQGHEKKQAAQAQDRFNGEMMSIDTAYGPHVASQGFKATKTDQGLGAFGGAISGGLSGYQTGASIEQGINKNNLYKEMLEEKKMKRRNANIENNSGKVAQGNMSQLDKDDKAKIFEAEIAFLEGM